TLRRAQSLTSAVVNFLFLVAGFLFFAGCGIKLPARETLLVVISMDGLAPAYYLEAQERGIRIPALHSLMERGVYSSGMQSVYPSVTYPAHVSLVTGVEPAVHGIFANSYYDRGEQKPHISGKLYQISPLWRSFRAHRLTCGSVFWPVTADEPIDWLLPEAWWDEDKGDDAVRLQKEAAISTPGLINSLRQYLGAPLEKYFESDTVKTGAAIYILKKHRPNLLLLHYSHLDYHQHVYGLFAPEAIETLQMHDAQIGRIVQATRELGVYEKTSFMIVSDHGHSGISWQVNPGVMLAKAGLIQIDRTGNVLSWKAMTIPTGGSCSIILRDENDVDTKAQVVEIAKQFAANPENGVEHLFLRAQIDSLGGDPHAIVMLEAQPGYAFGSATTGEVVAPSTSKATHGYLPAKAEMLAAFIAAGPKIVPAGNIGRIHILELYAVIAAIYGIRVEVRGAQVIDRIVKQHDNASNSE
ncbi:ectonucleotide pyrophosphatase/phosphodiesterase, partial [candidate division KSB1 bacterium]|nr:ectonucleotide pyrophosphatase/phosphodiesterase [candidate division KSB1 bacterium]